MSQHNVTIEIANRRLKITCPKGQESALLQAANEVNKRLATSNKKSQSQKTPEQAMLMTAVNLANDLLTQKQEFELKYQEMQSKIDLLQQTIEQAVNPPKNKKA